MNNLLLNFRSFDFSKLRPEAWFFALKKLPCTLISFVHYNKIAQLSSKQDVKACCRKHKIKQSFQGKRTIARYQIWYRLFRSEPLLQKHKKVILLFNFYNHDLISDVCKGCNAWWAKINLGPPKEFSLLHREMQGPTYPRDIFSAFSR